MRPAILIFTIFLFITCSNIFSYLKRSQDYYSAGNYNDALNEINLGLKKSPDNIELLNHKNIIILKLLESEYYEINTHNIEKRKQVLGRRKELLDRYSHSNSIIDTFKINWNSDFSIYQKDQNIYNTLISSIKEESRLHKFTSALLHLLQLKAYLGYCPQTDSIFVYFKDYFPALKTKMDEEFNTKNIISLEQKIALLDSAYQSNPITSLYKYKIQQHYNEQSRKFLNHKKFATALLYLLKANVYKDNDEEDLSAKRIFYELRQNNKEKLYIGIEGNLGTEKKQMIKQDLLNKTNLGYKNFCLLENDFNISTIVVLISLDYAKQNIKTLKPAKKKSKYLFNVSKIPNDIYHKAKAETEIIKEKLDSEALIADKWVIHSLNEKLKKYSKIMNSEEAFDIVPQYEDYYYTSTKHLISELIQISFKVIDLKSKSILLEDTIDKTSNRVIFTLIGAHPNDAFDYNNTSPFNEKREKDKFTELLDNFITNIIDTISYSIRTAFLKRGKIYSGLNEIPEAIESYLTGYFIFREDKLQDIDLDLNQIIPKKLQGKIYNLNPKSNLEYKLSLFSAPKISIED